MIKSPSKLSAMNESEKHCDLCIHQYVCTHHLKIKKLQLGMNDYVNYNPVFQTLADNCKHFIHYHRVNTVEGTDLQSHD